MKRLLMLCLTFWSVDSLLAQETWTLKWEGIDRYCLLDFPPSKTGSTGLPVVFNLHPYNWTAPGTRDYLRMHLLGDSVGFITVYPSASDLRHWNSGISDNPIAPTPNTDDVGFISLVIDSLIARYGVDTTRIYSCGWSNGGFMSLKLAGQLGNRIAAIASVAGVLSVSTASSYSSPKPVPVLLIHGTSDPEIPFYGGMAGWYSVPETRDFLTTKNLCELPAETLFVPDIDPTDGSTVEKYTYRSSANESQVVLYKVIGGLHVWPGAPPIGVPINRDIDASREIWDFFKQFTIDNIVSVGDHEGNSPEEFSLSQNYPNPFNPRTEIRYHLPAGLAGISEVSKVSLRVYDVLGREVATLVDQEQPAGVYRAEWNAAVSSGVYFYRLEAVGKEGRVFVETKKMMLVR